MKNFKKFVVMVTVLVFVFVSMMFAGPTSAKKGSTTTTTTTTKVEKEIVVVPTPVPVQAKAVSVKVTQPKAVAVESPVVGTVVKVDSNKKVNATILSDEVDKNGNKIQIGKIELNLPAPRYFFIDPKVEVSVVLPEDENNSSSAAPTAVETKTVTVNAPSASEKEMFQISFGIIYSAEVSDTKNGFDVSQKMGDNFGQISAQWNINKYSSVRYTFNTGDYKRAASFNGTTFGEESVKTTHRVDALYYPIPELIEVQPFVGAGVESLNVTKPLSAAGITLKDDYNQIVLGFTGGVEIPLLKKLFAKLEVSYLPYKISTDMLGANIFTEGNLIFSVNIGFKFL